jgi:hypothetical protein
MLLVDASICEIVGSGGTDLRDFHLMNINDDLTNGQIVIDKVSLDWNFGGNLIRMDFGGGEQWSGSVNSANAKNLVLLNFATLKPQIPFNGRNDNRLYFDTPIFSATQPYPTLSVQFYFSDGSKRKVYLLSSGLCGDRSFSVTSTGRIKVGNNPAQYWTRSVNAVYDVGGECITSWEHTNDKVE